MWSPLYTAIVLRPFGANEYYDSIRKIPACQEYFIANGHGDKLHAWFFHIPEAKKLVIVHHGNAGNMTHRMYLANAAIMCGAAVLLYDYRGYGSSTGNPSLAGLSEDGAAAYDFATGKLGFSPNQIVHFGESVGTGVACRLASTRPSAGLILQSPVASLPAVARAGVFVFRAYPDFAFPQPQFDNLSEIARVRVPVLLLHGKKDRLVPYQQSQWILARAGQPKQLVLFEDAGHNDMPAGSPRYQAVLSHFLLGLP
jgi:pimeloyl-ACP methyl ester carboxylesterase